MKNIFKNFRKVFVRDIDNAGEDTNSTHAEEIARQRENEKQPMRTNFSSTTPDPITTPVQQQAEKIGQDQKAAIRQAIKEKFAIANEQDKKFYQNQFLEALKSIANKISFYLFLEAALIVIKYRRIDSCAPGSMTNEFLLAILTIWGTSIFHFSSDSDDGFFNL